MADAKAVGGGREVRLSVLVVFATAVGIAAAQDANTRLADARKRIDAVDARIVALLQERATIVDEVGKIKKAANIPVNAPAREKQVLDQAAERAKAGPLPADAVRRIYAKIVQEMRDWEQTQVNASR